MWTNIRVSTETRKKSKLVALKHDLKTHDEAVAMALDVILTRSEETKPTKEFATTA